MSTSNPRPTQSTPSSQPTPPPSSLLLNSTIPYSHDNIDPELPSTNDPPNPIPSNFTPFFTLLTTNKSPITHHPSVHYVFSDDIPDTDPITTAALQVLDSTSTSSSPTTDGVNAGQAINLHERYILLDMDATGTNVLSAQSMSPDWAVTGAEVGMAPTWDEGGVNGEGGGGLMLRIEGMEVLEDGKGKQEVGERELEELVGIYERRMGELRRVVERGSGEGVGGGLGQEEMTETGSGS